MAQCGRAQVARCKRIMKRVCHPRSKTSKASKFYIFGEQLGRIKELTETIRSHERERDLLDRRLTALREGNSQLWDAYLETHDQLEQTRNAEAKTMAEELSSKKIKKIIRKRKEFDAKQVDVMYEIELLDEDLKPLRAELCQLLGDSLVEQGMIKTTAPPTKGEGLPEGTVSLGVCLSTPDLGTDCSDAASGPESRSENSDHEEDYPERLREKEKDHQQFWARVAFGNAATAADKADQAFEARFNKFEEEEARHQRKLEAGEEVEDVQEMYLRHFNETRRLTQEFAKAEEEYYQAKDAALAAGLDLRDAELESGFLDYPDDGYRLSEAKDDAGPVDHVRIANWIETVSSHEIEIEDQIEGEAAGTIEDWDAESIEMCDSRSMVAEGPERRRIMKWEASLRSQGLGQRPSASLEAKSEGQKYTEEDAVHTVELFACLPFFRP